MKVLHIENTPLRFRVFFRQKKLISIHKKLLKVTSVDYTEAIHRIQKKYGNEKIKVGFLVSEQAKWQYQSVYDELENNENFEPVILITQMTSVHYGKSHHYKTIYDCASFFESLRLRVQFAYDVEKKQYLSPIDLGIDILFYQQPWELYESQDPRSVYSQILTCYTTYGMDLMWYESSYMKDFHSFIWKIFVENEWMISFFNKIACKPVSNCLPVGYAKLDSYFLELPTLHVKKEIIIYAPHHSFEQKSLRCATFRENGMGMLTFAQKYKEQFHWIFKPHPRFKHAVILNGIMTETEIDAYYRAWGELGEVYEGGDYIPIFKQSSALITDSVSFLGEYLPSGHPVFQLVNEEAIFNDWGKEICASYYRVKNESDLEKEFNRVILCGDDYLEKQRKAMIPTILDRQEQTSKKIIRILINLLENKS